MGNPRVASHGPGRSWSVGLCPYYSSVTVIPYGQT